MDKESSGPDDFIIKIPKHIWKDQDDVDASKDKKADFNILERTGVSITSGERDTEYGKTQIQTFTLEEKEYGEKILYLLNNPALYAHTSKILQYIYEMGCDSDLEKGHFASVAVSKLSHYFPFTDLADAILWKWAEGPTFRSNYSAALALVHMIQNSQNQHDILSLLKDWSHQSNVRLVNTILMVLYEIAKKYPQESLDAVENILLDKKALLLYSSVGFLSYSYNEDRSIKLSWEAMIRRIFQLVEDLYTDHSLNVIETLYKWFHNRKSPNLTIFAAITFLSITSVKDIAKDDIKRAKAVAYLYELWEDQKAPEHHQLQQMTTNVVYNWAKTILEMKAEDPEQMLCIQFFHDLYEKCESAKQNRLDFHLKRWHTQLKQSRRSASLLSNQIDFLSLIPDSKQI